MITLYQCRYGNKRPTCAGCWSQERLWGWRRGTWGYTRTLCFAIILLSTEKCSKNTFIRERDMWEPKERHKPCQIRGLHLCLEQPRGFWKVPYGPPGADAGAERNRASGPAGFASCYTLIYAARAALLPLLSELGCCLNSG